MSISKAKSYEEIGEFWDNDFADYWEKRGISPDTLLNLWPLWLDRALPILKDFLNNTIVTLENWWAFLKFFAGHIADIFVRIYEKFVLGVD